MTSDDDTRADEDRAHACLTCVYPCDCGEAPDECRGCYYCVEEAFDRNIREEADDDQT